MAMMNKLGFGMMRLPVKNGDPADLDYEQINQMVDDFSGAGFGYFGTSYVYRNGKSEGTVWRMFRGRLSSFCAPRIR